jgi:hypothetical protein
MEKTIVPDGYIVFAVVSNFFFVLSHKWAFSQDLSLDLKFCSLLNVNVVSKSSLVFGSRFTEQIAIPFFLK